MGYFLADSLNDVKKGSSHVYDGAVVVTVSGRLRLLCTGPCGRFCEDIESAAVRYDPDTALFLVSYYGFRYYDPVTGRWPSRDPLGEEMFFSTNTQKLKAKDRLILRIHTEQVLYAFLSNDGIGKYDILGLSPCSNYPNPAPKCRDEDGCDVDDDYPGEAQSICEEFMELYDNSDEVTCVAKCLVRVEGNIQQYKSCDLRDAARLVAHTGCYTECGFVPNPFKGKLGLPSWDAWGLGIFDLLPDFLDVGIGGTNIE